MTRSSPGHLVIAPSSSLDLQHYMQIVIFSSLFQHKAILTERYRHRPTLVQSIRVNFFNLWWYDVVLLSWYKSCIKAVLDIVCGSLSASLCVKDLYNGSSRCVLLCSVVLTPSEFERRTGRPFVPSLNAPQPEVVHQPNRLVNICYNNFQFLYGRTMPV